MNRTRNFILSLFLVIALPCFTQEPVQIHFTEKEGLPDKEFYNVAEDSKGFIWLAGNKGLTRYDGTSFTTLEHPEKRGLSVFQLQVDHTDRVWCINISGQLFYTEGKELELYADLKEELKGSLAEVKVTTKYISLITHFVLIIFDRETGEQQTIDLSNHTLSLPEVINDELYFLYDEQLVRITENGLEKVYDVNLNFRTTATYRSGTIKLIKLSDDSLLLYAVNEQLDITLYRISKEGYKKIDIPDELKGKQVTSIKYVDNTYWWLTGKGAFAIHITDQAIIVRNRILSKNYVTDVNDDIEGNLWFSTLRDGIYVLPNLAIETIDLPNEYGLVSRMEEGAEDDILIGFSSGNVIVYDTKQQESTLVNLPEERRLSSLLYNKEKETYWYFQDISTYAAPVIAPSDYERLQFRQVSVKSIVALGEDYYAFANSGTVVIAKEDLLDAHITKDNARFFAGKRGYKVFKSSVNEHIYLATVDELIVLDKFLNPTVIKNEQGKDILGQSITQTDDDHVWIATFTNGIYELIGTEVVAHYTQENGLLSNRTTVVAAQGNDVWIGTDKGLQLLKRDGGDINISSLTKQDGILSYDVKDIIIKEKYAYIATGNGIFKMDTKRVFKTFEPSKVYVTDVVINGVDRPIKDHYELKQDESDFMVRFNANGFRGLSNGLFKYRLLGLSTSWTKLRQGDNDVQFATLPRGDYTFQLAPVNDADYPDNLISIALVVSVPFYKTYWFYAILGLLFMGGVIIYYRRLLQRKESQRTTENERLQLANQLTALKLENLQSQMNPHFIFNALNSIQEYIVHNEKDLASSYLVKFSRLIRMYLEQSRKNNITLDDELKAMRLYLELEKVRFEDKLEYNIEIDDNVVPSQCMIPPLFIQPYIENAIKHGLLHRKYNRRLLVHFKYRNEIKTLEVLIEDNGVGRVATQAMKDAHPGFHKSFATQANDNRVALLNKNRSSRIVVTVDDLYDNEIASGTRVKIEIPN